MVVYLSRPMVGSGRFSEGDIGKLRAKMSLLRPHLFVGLPSRAIDFKYRIKITLATVVNDNGYMVEFVFQSGARYRYLFTNGGHENALAKIAGENQVRHDRIIDLSRFESWNDVKAHLLKSLVRDEDSRGKEHRAYYESLRK